MVTGKTDGQTDERTDGQTDGRTDGQTGQTGTGVRQVAMGSGGIGDAQVCSTQATTQLRLSTSNVLLTPSPTLSCTLRALVHALVRYYVTVYHKKRRETARNGSDFRHVTFVIRSTRLEHAQLITQHDILRTSCWTHATVTRY